MGITGLLPFVKKASTKCHIRKFSGCTVAIDAYCWLHKGAFGCADKLGKGEPTTAYITYCLKYINVLLSHNIKPILVLDGRNLISKAHTEKQRRERRDENKKNAKEFLRKGMKKEAWECFTRCIDITPAMAREFIKTLRSMKLDYIVAPYEADAQLAYLARKNIVDIVITEDSDLILFGCPKIFFKMSVLGDGVLFDQSKIHSCMDVRPQQFQFERFRWMAMLSGCDYLASLPGIGLARSKKVIKGTTSSDFRKILESIPRVLGLDIDVTEEYIKGFIRAENTFLYQLVFDPINRRLIPLTSYPADIDRKDLDYAGFYVDKKVALDMALGNVDIHTLKKVDDFDPIRSNSGYNETSMWSPNFKISSEPRMLTIRDMKNGTKHSSTIGMQANVSVSSSIKKRALLIDTEFENAKKETKDEELICMYSATDEPEVEMSPFQPETLNEQTIKRMRLEDGYEKEDDGDLKSPISKKINPFLKSPKVSTTTFHPVTVNSSSNPLCLIEKNKIYNCNDDNILVKSQYFRNMDIGNEEKGLKNIRSMPKLKNSNFNIKIESSEEKYESADSQERKQVEDGENIETSQMSIYSLRRHSLCDELETSQKLSDNELSDCDEGSKTFTNSASNREDEVETLPSPPNILTVYGVEDDFKSQDDEIKYRLRSSPMGSKSKSSNSKAVKALGPCKRIGLSRYGSKTKIDPKQKTISSMFALQQKSKL